MNAPRVVVGIEHRGEKDWIDAWGNYWAWDAKAGLWRHERARCQLGDGRECKRRLP